MSQHTDPANPHGASAEHAEYDTEISNRPVYWTGVILIGTALLSFAAMWAFMRGMEKYDQSHARKPSVLQSEIDQQRTQGPPAPLLQPDPNRDMREMRAEEDQVLSTYGWVDKASGTVRIPIQDAITLLAAKGLGTKPAAVAPAAAPVAPAVAAPAGAHP